MDLNCLGKYSAKNNLFQTLMSVYFFVELEESSNEGIIDNQDLSRLESWIPQMSQIIGKVKTIPRL